MKDTDALLMYVFEKPFWDAKLINAVHAKLEFKRMSVLESECSLYHSIIKVKREDLALP